MRAHAQGKTEMNSDTKLRSTPLHDEQEKLNARFIEFGDWRLPVQFSSIIDEHNAVRNHAGLFDASHMGEFIVSGPKAEEFLNKMTTADIRKVVEGQAKYALLLNENGGVIDDLIIYRRKDDFFVVVNASNTSKDFAWLEKNMIDGLSLKDLSESTCLIAIQGPQAAKILQPLVRENLAETGNYRFLYPSFNFFKHGKMIAGRTGYTGEDGFEIFGASGEIITLWDKLITLGVKPCGLGARDTLRLEACMPLHGHEINDDITPLEAGLEWAVSYDKDFIGKGALLEKKKKRPDKFQIAFILENGIPRANCAIITRDQKAGYVTSGTFSPTLRKGIGLGYINEPPEIGQIVSIQIQAQVKPAKVVKKPFYRRQK
jgi:aminomethyltransferase